MPAAVAGLKLPALPSNSGWCMIRACSTRAPTGIRNRALIAVLCRSGLRIAEALALELRDVDLQTGTLRVRHGKGDKSRTVGVDEQTSALLARWLDRRRRLSPGARAPVFCTLDGGRVDSSYVRHLLPRLAAKAGLDRRVHARRGRAPFIGPPAVRVAWSPSMLSAQAAGIRWSSGSCQVAATSRGVL